LEESTDFEYNLMSLFADGGMMMYALVLCSLIALGVIIAKAWTLWVAHRDTDRILAEVEALTKKGRIDDAIRLAAETPGRPRPSSSPGSVGSGRDGSGAERSSRP
jgi:biopolymer transport protein ExbB/TolQ